jgi:hypothetical protein
MAAVGTLDLASVTDALVAALQLAVDSSPLWGLLPPQVPAIEIEVTGESPDVARAKGDCQLCLSLIHVAPDANYRNRSLPGPGGIVTAPEPMALTLTYVLIAFAGKSYVQEQQAMSTALAWIASHPIQRLTVTAVPAHMIECTLTIETATLDEIARLWQSLTGAMRLTALLRVAVVFVGSDPAPGPAADRPSRIGMLVAPASSLGASPQLLAVAGPILIGEDDPAVPNTQLSPGEVGVVSAIGLLGTESLFLSPLDDSDSFDVTPWVTHRGPNTLHLKLPAAGAPPAGTPDPGTYRLRMGSPTGASILLEVGP